MKRLLCCLLALVLLAMGAALAEETTYPDGDYLRTWLLQEYGSCYEVSGTTFDHTFAHPLYDDEYGTTVLYLSLAMDTMTAFAIVANPVFYEPEKALEVSRICNRLNQRWGGVCFVNQTEYNQVRVAMSVPYLNPEDVGETMRNMIAPFPDALADLYAQMSEITDLSPTFQHKIAEIFTPLREYTTP